VYGTDGVEDPPNGEGFQVFSPFSDVATEPLRYLNPQTQETVLGDPVASVARQPAQRYRSVTRGKARVKAKLKAARASRTSPVVRHLAP
jgi:hypothetical protein